MDNPDQATPPPGNALEFLKGLFWNRTEGRLRAGWRILAHLAFLAALVGLSVLAFSVVHEFVVKPFLSNPAVRLVANLTEVSLTWVCVLLSLVFAGRFIDHRPFKRFGFALTRRWWLDLGFGLVLGALLMAAVFGIEYALGWITIAGYIQTGSSSFAAGFLFYIGLFIAVGIQEEVLTRGYWLRNLAEGFNFRVFGPKTALLIGYVLSSSIFGFLHLGNPNASAVSTINLILAGFFLGLPYVLTGDLAIPIGLHISWNLFQGNVFGFPVSGAAPSTTWIAIQQGGPEAWTGGAFGPEAGLIGLAAMLVGSGAIVLWLRFTHGSLSWCSGLASYAADVKKGGADE
ncbi:MAG: CPBP family intramembrane glutamic endopeptidase [Chloroflexota bacterium]